MKTPNVRNGAQIILSCISERGIDHIFGYPDVCTLSIFDALGNSPIKFVQTVTPNGSCFSACGYHKTSGKIGVVVTSYGAGLASMQAGILNANADEIPLVVICGTACDSVAMTDFFVTNVYQLAPTMRRAFELADGDHKRAVLITVASTVFDDVAEYRSEATKKKTIPIAPSDDIRRVADEINASSRPLVYVGKAVHDVNATDSLNNIIFKRSASVAVTHAAVGTITPTDENYLGTQDSQASLKALRECDLLILIGTALCQKAKAIVARRKLKTISIDVDGKNAEGVALFDHLYGNVKHSLTVLESIVTDNQNEEWAFREFVRNEGLHRGIECLKRLFDRCKDISTIAVDSGLTKSWVVECYPYATPRLTASNEIGVMGYALPASIGAYFGDGKKSLCVTGDGSFSMSGNELATAVKNHVPLVVALFNNSSLGEVRKAQKGRAGRRVASSVLYLGTDYCALAKAMGARSVKVEETDDINQKLDEALRGSLPVLIEFQIGVNDGI